ncbi:SDR family NAD(P)-dependent oxidoreductase [Demequina capsici]|uniref:SDR family oxidoreductase n=1 Tax=Demequina capsici TaxID=3075620 RepID=A0AA96J8Z4_9MICO|nr:SDR family oxidoreductase [Demequina sp. OYTSA14]WNM25830.1 SDR family oxidoreductase [Demequina sp. OYTSA14]
MTANPRCVVVTGASSGFGVEFARRFAARGASLVLVARRKDRLDALALELEAAHGVKCVVIPMDLAEPGAAQRIAAELATRDIQPDALINNAGFGIDGPFAESDPDAVRRLLQVNVVALTELTRLLLPALLDAKHGVLLNVASTAAFQPLPSIALYAASKAYVRSLTEALWKEAEGTPLRVLALCPGPTETEFFKAAGSERFKVGQVLTVEAVVDEAFAALSRARTRPTRVAGWRNRVTAHASRLAPTRVALRVAADLTKD